MHGLHGKSDNPRTIYAELSDLSYEMIEQNLGYATVLRFSIPEEKVRTGDVLVILDGREIRFHGMINSIDQKGRAVASDRSGSRILLKI